MDYSDRQLMLSDPCVPNVGVLVLDELNFLPIYLQLSSSIVSDFVQCFPVYVFKTQASIIR